MKTTGRGLVVVLAIAVLGMAGLPLEGRTAPPQVTPQKPGQPPAPLPPLPVPLMEDRLGSGQAFSLSFSEPVTIRELLLLMLRGTNYSVVVDPDVEGTFTGELKDVTLKRALDAALRPLKLQYTFEDNLLHVFRRTTETRLFNLNYVATRRTGNRSTRAATDAAGSIQSLSSTDSTDFFAEIEKGVDTLRSSDSRFNLDRKAGVLQVTDYTDRLDRIQTYLELVQLRVNRQVQIQGKILEVDLNDEFRAGIDWSAVVRRAGNSVMLTQPLEPAQAHHASAMAVTVRNFTGLLEALATQGTVNVLSSPLVTAMNNEPAILRTGTEDVLFDTVQHADATDGVIPTALAPQSLIRGVVLSVTPQTSADGIIQLSITPRVTERTGDAASRLGDTAPIVSVREADTVVRVREGETIVIAGLMQERSKTKAKTELVILLTPTVMTPAEIAGDARAQDKIHESQMQPMPIKK